MNNKFGSNKPFDTGSLFSSIDKLQSKRQLRKQKKWESKKLFNKNQFASAQASNNKQLGTNVHYSDMMEYAKEDRKVRRFMWIAMPIIIIEILAIAGLAVFFFSLPKNFCRISTNTKDCTVFVNSKKLKKFRFTKPKTEAVSYHYGVDVSIELPDGYKYLVSYTVVCDNYKAVPSTTATVDGNTYTLEVEGGTKTQLFDGLTIVSSKEYIKNFDVDIKINAQKV